MQQRIVWTAPSSPQSTEGSTRERAESKMRAAHAPSQHKQRQGNGVTLAAHAAGKHPSQNYQPLPGLSRLKLRQPTIISQTDM